MKFRLLLLLSTLLSFFNQELHAQCTTSSQPSSNPYFNLVCIDGFTLAGTASNNVGAPSSGYGSYSTPVRSMTIGSTYSYSITLAYYTCGTAIWIDLNGNNIYESSEMIVSNPTSTGPVTGNLTIPSTATPGNNVRMRLRCSYASTISGSQACTNFSYGETEDYYVNLVPPCYGPDITSQPSDQLACPGGMASFSLNATSAATYQWQVRNGSNWSDLSNNSNYSGTDTRSLHITSIPQSFDGKEYRCRTVSSCGTPTISDGAYLNFHPPTVFLSQPSPISICKWSQIDLEVEVNDNSTFQWQYGDPTNGYVNVPAQYPFSGVTSDKLSIANVDASLDGIYFRCMASGACSPKASNDIPVDVRIGPHIFKQPEDMTVTPYAVSSFMVEVQITDAYEVNWQMSDDGGNTYTNIYDNALYKGTKAHILRVNTSHPGMDGTMFRCIMKSTNPDCGIYEDTSNAATLNVVSPNAVNDINNANSLVIYPNPASGNEVYLNMGNISLMNASINVVDKLGKVIYTLNTDITGTKAVLPVNTLPAGTYSVLIRDNNGLLVNTARFTKL